MKETNYVFKYTEENGYRKATLSSKLQNEIFKYRKKEWNNSYLYFVNEDKGHILMARTIPLWFKLLSTIAYPVILLIYGVANYKDLNKEYGDMWNELKRGKFSADDIYKGRGDDTYGKLLKNLKFK